MEATLMQILKLTPADVEAIMTRLGKGQSVLEVATELGISVEMVLCAKRNWPNIRQHPLWPLY
jgi:DNA-binding CsgD family transcriptional regulator